LDKKEVRQAIAYIIDRQEVNDLAFGGMGTTYVGGAPLQPPGSPYYFKDLEGYYNTDWNKARALLKQAGYNSPADVPTLEIISTEGAISGQPAKVIMQQLTEFGLSVEYKTIDVPTLTPTRPKVSTSYTWTVEP